MWLFYAVFRDPITPGITWYIVAAEYNLSPDISLLIDQSLSMKKVCFIAYARFHFLWKLCFVLLRRLSFRRCYKEVA